MLLFFFFFFFFLPFVVAGPRDYSTAEINEGKKSQPEVIEQGGGDGSQPERQVQDRSSGGQPVREDRAAPRLRQGLLPRGELGPGPGSGLGLGSGLGPRRRRRWARSDRALFSRQSYVPTVFENYTASFEIDTQRIELSLWDTSGERCPGGVAEERQPRRSWGERPRSPSPPRPGGAARLPMRAVDGPDERLPLRLVFCLYSLFRFLFIYLLT